MQTTLKFSLLPLLVMAALVPSTEAKIEQVKRACVEVEVVADQCARKHYSPYKLEHSKTQPYVKKCFSNRAHVTDLMLDCAEPMALGIFLTCSVDSVAKTAGKDTHDPDFKRRTKAFKTCVEKGLQGTVPAETDPYEFDKRRKKKIRRRLADPSGEGLFNNVFPRYAHDYLSLSLVPPPRWGGGGGGQRVCPSLSLSCVASEIAARALAAPDLGDYVCVVATFEGIHVVGYCSVPQCRTHAIEPGASLHMYPQDRRLREVWIAKVGTGKRPSASTLVCSKICEDFCYGIAFTMFGEQQKARTEMLACMHCLANVVVYELDAR
ncbi:uncharacterized protein LOC142591327 [Dermacentor variabilis]|uniref:uncharacterized protein LOC142591327 n=1 Tax=Dermacentor variabilis TaxID=34621 RepID=UPI003F5BBC99